MHYADALKTLAALGPELRTGVGAAAPSRKFTLEHIRILLGALGDPQQRFRSVLIAGTNGKGSTAATLASIANAAGLRTALYTSPHLVRVNERMRITAGAPSSRSPTSVAVPSLIEIPTPVADPPLIENPPLAETPLLIEISDEDFGRIFGQVYGVAEKLVGQGSLPFTPSFFELLTATAFVFFAEQGVHLAVLEVGLGGRLDATNVVEPIVSVITDIGLDHTEFLGNTLGEIAREKAGILRQHGVLVTLSQHPEANAAIGELAMALEVRGVDAARCLPPRGFVGRQGHAGKQEAPVPLSPIGEGVQRGSASLAFNRNEQEGPVPIAHAAAGAQTAYAHNFASLQDPASLPTPAPLPIPAPAVAEPSPLGRNAYPLSIDGRILEIDSPLAGGHQQRNIALAVATALELRANHGFALSNHAIEAGVRATVWPGRLEWLAPKPNAAAGTAPPHAPLLLDVAHNPAGAWTLRAALAQLPDERPRTLLFSCLADKQIDEMARILFPLFDATAGDPARRRDHIVFAPIGNPRAATVDQLLAAAHALDVPAHAAPHLAAALGQAKALTPPEGVIVVTGSVYLIGEVRAMMI